MMHCPPVWLVLLRAWQGSDLCNLSHFVAVSSFKKATGEFWGINSVWHIYSSFWVHLSAACCSLLVHFFCTLSQVAIDLYIACLSLGGLLCERKHCCHPVFIICLPSKSRNCQKPSEVDGSSHWIIPLQSHLSAIFTVCQLSITRVWPCNILGASFLCLYRGLINCLFVAEVKLLTCSEDLSRLLHWCGGGPWVPRR